MDLKFCSECHLAIEPGFAQVIQRVTTGPESQARFGSPTYRCPQHYAPYDREIYHMYERYPHKFYKRIPPQEEHWQEVNTYGTKI